MNQVCKTVLIGDSGCGKTSLVQRLSKGTFNETQQATVGATFVDIEFKDVAGGSNKLRIWDTCGQEMFRSVVPMYFRNSSCVLLVFDINNMESFKGMNSWLSVALSSAPEETPVVVLGTKSDLYHAVPDSIINDFVKPRGYYYFEVSSKTNEGVKEAFDEIFKVALARQVRMVKKQQDKIDEEIDKQKCC
ncbi:GTP-binding protein ypt5, putative [Entamoeba invadens IP1]|uniref:GTP-binding protein ypt5, putative n=1 Tax=Entamoeba invadens IP1 TaxID=370355 RepID=A0A0A1U1B8_ENTIV|nr:GTP-binding protein ypt5, putative [Entamoeba invadens IP1]ELP87800.1 GTP-binding protein ypt5, putative [Entamoeba invadens IP1]|eukprot:XP_004254571.1 GTP-binding protein ypt5, putative [Entamoeba invadens IP1]